MTEKKAVTRRDLEEAVIRKALTDVAFRGELTTNPRAALERTLAELEPSARLPATLHVQALEEPQDAFYIVIPHAKAGEELSEAELERVAGGVYVNVSVGESF